MPSHTRLRLPSFPSSSCSMIKILYDFFFTFPSHSVHQVLHEWSHKRNIRQRLKICEAPHSIAHSLQLFNIMSCLSQHFDTFRPSHRHHIRRLKYIHLNNVKTEIQTRARNCTYYTLSVSTKKLTLRVTTRYSSLEEGEAVVPAGLEVLSSSLPARGSYQQS